MRFFKFLSVFCTLWGVSVIAQDSLHVRALGLFPRVSEYWDYRMGHISGTDTLIAINAAGWGVKLINAADVWHPVEASTISEFAGGAAVRGHYVYTCNTWFKIFNISDPHNPVQVCAIPCYLEFPYNVKVSGDYAYVCDEMEPAWVYQVANPASPVLVGSVGHSNSYDIEIAGTLAYIAHSQGVEIVDISDPANPVTLGGWLAVNSTPRDVEPAGDYAYVADGEGVPILNVANPAAPTLVHYLNTPSVAFGVDVVSHFLFVAQGADGLRIYDISDPANPVLAGYYDTWGNTMGVIVHGAVAYVAEPFVTRLLDVSYFVPSCEPQAPANLVVRYLPSVPGMCLDWNPVHLDTMNRPVALSHYAVFRAEYYPGDWTTIGAAVPPDTTFTDTVSIGQGSGCYYRVRAVGE